MAIYIVEAINNPVEWEVVLHDEFNRPIDALKKWCELEEDYPTCVTIRLATKNDGLEFIRWCHNNWETVETILSRVDLPYQISFMKEVIEGYWKRNKTSMEWDGDEISPFSFG